jgi:hypothetical protein
VPARQVAIIMSNEKKFYVSVHDKEYEDIQRSLGNRTSMMYPFREGEPLVKIFKKPGKTEIFVEEHGQEKIIVSRSFMASIMEAPDRKSNPTSIKGQLIEDLMKAGWTFQEACVFTDVLNAAGLLPK